MVWYGMLFHNSCGFIKSYGEKQHFEAIFSENLKETKMFGIVPQGGVEGDVNCKTSRMDQMNQDDGETHNPAIQVSHLIRLG